MAYTPEQRKVIRKVLATGRKMGASRKEMLAAIETGLVESNFRNLNYGDADSKGWRQERQMYYKNPTNVGASAKRYFTETKAERGNYRRPGELAQAVQRSAFPDRYAQHGDQAKDILKAFNRGKFGKGSGKEAKRGRGRRAGAITQTTDVPGVDNSALRRQMLQGYLLERNDPNALLNLVTGLEGAKDISGSTATSQTKGPRYKREKKKRYQGKSSVKGLQVRKDQNHGAKSLAEQAGRGFVTSGERTPAENAAVGGASGSDHLSTNRWASAVDMKYGTGRQVAKRLGLKDWKPGTYDRHTVTVGGRKYSVQILENVEGHYDHTHLGVQRVK